MKENNRKGSSSEKFLNKEIILNELNIVSGQKIIEIGCGNGYMSKEFARLVGNIGKVYAIDILPDIIDNLKKETQGTNIIPILSDITKDKIKIYDASIDLIYLATVFHIFTEKQIKTFQNEVKRLLKPNGKLAILNINNKDNSFGPPKNMRVTNEKLIEIIKLNPTSSIRLGGFFYMQIFEKSEKMIKNNEY